jgi:pyruvate kinase
MPFNRRTKILATLGPATDAPGVLDAMLIAGLDGARINCSHGTVEDWRRRVATVRAAATEFHHPIAIVADLQGPKIRLSPDLRECEVAAGDEVVFTGPGVGDESSVSIDWDQFGDAISAQSEIVIGDGTPRFAVRRLIGTNGDRRAITTCLRGGRLGPRKGANVTHADREAPALTRKDIDDLDFVVECEAEFVALSFVRSAADIELLRAALRVRGSHARVIAKIEKTEALECLDEIVEAADAIMVARGDLGVEAGVARVPLMQKRIIHTATAAGKLVITATQMLESMITSPEPTRAEATDVANAVIDGTSALMLSAETAKGAYPAQAVEWMGEIAHQAQYAELFHVPWDAPASGSAAVMQAAVMLAQRIDAQALIIPTSTGGSVRACVKYRPQTPVLGLALSEHVAAQLALEWGVLASAINPSTSLEEFISEALVEARDLGHLTDGDTVVLTYGPVVAEPGSTNLIAVRTIGD